MFIINFMIYIIFFTLAFCCDFSDADTKIYISNFHDTTTYIQSNGIEFGWRDNIDEYSARLNQYRCPGVEKYKLSFNGDWDYQKEYSEFAFAEYNYNSILNADYARAGVGLAWLPENFNDRLKYPYFHKISVAAIFDSTKDYCYASWRYRLEMIHQGIALKAVFFWLGYSETSSMVISVPALFSQGISGNFVYLYEYERINGYKDSKQSLGFEIKI